MATVFGVWLILSPGWAVRSLEARAHSALGHELKVTGGASLQIAPRLAIRFDGVRMAPEDNLDAPLISEATVIIPVSPLDVLRRRLPVEEIGLAGGNIAFLIDERGRANWLSAAADSEMSTGLRVENAAIRYFDARNGQTISAGKLAFSGEVSGSGTWAFEGTTVVNKRLIKFETYLKSANRVHDDGSPFSLAITAPDLIASLEGRLSTAKILSAAGIVSLTVPDLRAAAQWAGAQQGGTRGFKDFRATGALDVVGRALAIRNAAFQIDGVDGEGEAALDLRGDVPKLQAAASLPRLVVDTYIESTSGNSSTWSPQLLGFEALKNLDVKATFLTQSLSWAKVKLGSAAIGIEVEGGKAKAEVVPKLKSGGSATISVGIDSNETPPAFSIDVAAKGVEAAELLPFVSGIRMLAGKGAVQASLRGSGRTQQEIVGSLEGSASVSLADGELKGADIEKMLGEVSQRILTGWGKAGSDTPFTKLDARFAVKDGIAEFRSGKIENGTMAATAKGEADLLREAVNITADPRLKVSSGATAGLPVTITVKGPWQKPKIYPDMPGILKNPAQAFEKLKSEGLQQITPTSGN